MAFQKETYSYPLEQDSAMSWSAGSWQMSRTIGCGSVYPIPSSVGYQDVPDLTGHLT